MDHSMTGTHHGVSPAMDHMMMMYFHGGYNEVILFDIWRISTLGGLIGSMVGCFVLGILYEGVKSYREYWMRGTFQTVKYNQVSEMIFCKSFTLTYKKKFREITYMFVPILLTVWKSRQKCHHNFDGKMNVFSVKSKQS